MFGKSHVVCVFIPFVCELDRCWMLSRNKGNSFGLDDISPTTRKTCIPLLTIIIRSRDRDDFDVFGLGGENSMTSCCWTAKYNIIVCYRHDSIDQSGPD